MITSFCQRKKDIDNIPAASYSQCRFDLIYDYDRENPITAMNAKQEFFLHHFEVEGSDDEAKEEMERIFNDKLDIRDQFRNIGQRRFTGNQNYMAFLNQNRR